MEKIKKIKFFQFAAIGTLVMFIGLMAFVTVIAYSRPSGYTGLSMGKIQQMRAQISSN